MDTQRGNESSEARLAYGTVVASSVRLDPLTNHLAEPLDVANQDLEEAWLARLSGWFACHAADGAIRVPHAELGLALSSVLRLVRSEAGGAGSALEREIFPDGPEGARAHNGADQLARAVAIRDRLAASTNIGAEAVRSAYLARFTSVVQVFAEAVARIGASDAEFVRLRDVEEKARIAHSGALARTEIGLRAVFPDDPKRRRRYEPRNTARPRARQSEDLNLSEVGPVELIDDESAEPLAPPPPNVTDVA